LGRSAAYDAQTRPEGVERMHGYGKPVWRVVAALVVVGTVGVSAGAAAAQEAKARCWPPLEGCPAKEYERKAAQVASRAADDRFGRDIPPGQWRVTCYPGESRRRIECSFQSIDSPPADCVGGATMVKRDGRWRGRNVELSCSR
jgi:hypothetical protein